MPAESFRACSGNRIIFLNCLPVSTWIMTAVEFLIDQEDDPIYGARPMRRAAMGV